MFRFIPVLVFFVFVFQGIPCHAQRIEPPNWWVAMKNPNLQIMVHEPGIARFTRAEVKSPGVRIEKIRRAESPNYLFIDLITDSTLKPGSFTILLKNDQEEYSFQYEYRERNPETSQKESFDASDVVYLLMPDRFSNGDETNDSVPEALEKANRKDIHGRHGGDIQGIIDRLGYLEDLGITALWSTPLLFDNEAISSYHSYAISDFYRIDPRFGTNTDYRRLADSCHTHGIKLIMDLVPNHCGTAHWWMNDLPQPDWIHQFPEYTRSNFRIATWNDPYAAESDFRLNQQGWFDKTMPDLNQENELLFTYLVQNAIWWVEFAGLDGLRVDTYPYNNKWAIANWARAIREEYPWINIVGECWQHRPSEIAYWQSGVDNYDGYDSGLPSVMDFCLTDAIGLAFNEDTQGWDQGVARLYQSLVTDYLYPDPFHLLIFCDNHDITRFSGTVGMDPAKYKLAFSFLFTTRGIPQIHAGSEIMMAGDKSKGDGDIRRDFPGGWPGDARNAFDASGRTELENEIFRHFRTLLNYRKNNPVLQYGDLIHHIPRDNLYVFFRKNPEKTVMIILNNNPDHILLSTDPFREEWKTFTGGTDILTGESIPDLNRISVPGKSSLIIELSNHERQF